MNAKEWYSWMVLPLVLLAGAGARADSAREMLAEGNKLFAEAEYTEAINKYNEVLLESPKALEPKFNKANSYYRLDDLGEAIDLYQEVAAESKDMSLVAKAKYNLGNCFFQRGSKQRDSDLKKAVEDMKTSIAHWRQVLEIDSENEKAARNIEVARLTIKDLLDQLKKQQENQQQQQQQGQQDQQQQQQQGQGQQQSPPEGQGKPDASEDPNEARDPNQPQDEGRPQDPNETQDKQEPQQQQQSPTEDQQQQKETVVPDTTAQEILDKEQRQKEQRRILQRTQTRKVEKDW
ncbi:MAG: tetratricopeptide repeat protein [Sedimentisphaerales bacterium]|nr:tetratricopeptide repeat protein [Sedimentisphaerales bacterium]